MDYRHLRETTVSVLRGLGTYVPGCQPVYRLLSRQTVHETGGADSPRYCYSVFLRHLVVAHRSGLPTEHDVVAELGPGNSLGVGLCALLTGANRYLALDAVRHARATGLDKLLDAMVDLLKNRTPIPTKMDSSPAILPTLESYEFPSQILTDERLAAALAPERLQRIRESLIGVVDSRRDDTEFISYRAPWSGPGVVEPASVDFILSQYVMEHVDDVPGTYAALFQWLKPGGTMSHQVDFHSHGLTSLWNGHWRYNDLTWSLIRGKRPYLINRLPNSHHVSAAKAAGFEVLVVKPTRISADRTAGRETFADRFRNVTDDDLSTVSCLLQLRKPAV